MITKGTKVKVHIGNHSTYGITTGREFKRAVKTPNDTIRYDTIIELQPCGSFEIGFMIDQHFRELSQVSFTTPSVDLYFDEKFVNLYESPTLQKECFKNLDI